MCKKRVQFPRFAVIMTNACVADYIEDICPYATFQLSKPPYSESTYSGNVYSGPYHSVRGSFVYHDPKPAGAESYKFRQVMAATLFTMIFNTAVDVAVMVYICVVEVLSSNISSDNGYPD
jgi:hypothetical protein